MEEARTKSPNARRFPLRALAVILGLVSGCFDLRVGQPSGGDRPAGAPEPNAAARLLSPLIERTVSEGDTVVLRTGAPLEDVQTATYVWVQASGPVVELDRVFTPIPTFVAPQVDKDTILVFQFVLIIGGASSIQQTIIHVLDVAGPGAEPPCGAAGCAPGTLCTAATGRCETVNRCDGISCGSGRVCDEASGTCVEARACGDEVCGSAERCNPETTLCEPACPGVTCEPGLGLDPETCTCDVHDRCENVTCPAGSACTTETGNCEPVDRCIDVTCDAGATCDALTGRCVTQNLCADESCPAGTVCDPETGDCLVDGLCSEPAAGALFVVAGTSVGPTQFTMMPEFRLEFDKAVDATTFDPGDVQVMQAGPDNRLGTADDVAVLAAARHDGSHRITVSLAPETGELLAGRWYRVSLSAGCLRATAGAGSGGLDGEFDGTFPSGDGQFGGAFVQEFLGVAAGPYAGDLICDEETRDILGRVEQEQVRYDDRVAVSPTGVLLLDGQPVRVGEKLSPQMPGFDFEMTAEVVAPLSDGIHIVYDVVGTMDQYAFDGPQDESYTFLEDGTILHAGRSDFSIRTNRGQVVAEFTRTCSGTLRR